MAALTMPEAMPLTELAKATMQTNNGAGLGTAMTWRSTKKAVNAVALVRAGPEIARQSNCMPVLVASRNLFSLPPGNKACSLPDISTCGGFFRSHPEAAVERPGKTFAFLKSNDN